MSEKNEREADQICSLSNGYYFLAASEAPNRSIGKCSDQGTSSIDNGKGTGAWMKLGEEELIVS